MPWWQHNSLPTCIINHAHWPKSKHTSTLSNVIVNRKDEIERWISTVITLSYKEGHLSFPYLPIIYILSHHIGSFGLPCCRHQREREAFQKWSFPICVKPLLAHAYLYHIGTARCAAKSIWANVKSIDRDRNSFDRVSWWLTKQDNRQSYPKR